MKIRWTLFNQFGKDDEINSNVMLNFNAWYKSWYDIETYIIINLHKNINYYLPFHSFKVQCKELK